VDDSGTPPASAIRDAIYIEWIDNYRGLLYMAKPRKNDVSYSHLKKMALKRAEEILTNLTQREMPQRKRKYRNKSGRNGPPRKRRITLYGAGGGGYNIFLSLVPAYAKISGRDIATHSSPYIDKFFGFRTKDRGAHPENFSKAIGNKIKSHIYNNLVPNDGKRLFKEIYTIWDSIPLSEKIRDYGSPKVNPSILRDLMRHIPSMIDVPNKDAAIDEFFRACLIRPIETFVKEFNKMVSVGHIPYDLIELTARPQTRREEEFPILLEQPIVSETTSTTAAPIGETIEEPSSETEEVGETHKDPIGGPTEKISEQEMDIPYEWEGEEEEEREEYPPMLELPPLSRVSGPFAQLVRRDYDDDSSYKGQTFWKGLYGDKGKKKSSKNILPQIKSMAKSYPLSTYTDYPRIDTMKSPYIQNENELVRGKIEYAQFIKKQRPVGAPIYYRGTPETAPVMEQPIRQSVPRKELIDLIKDTREKYARLAIELARAAKVVDKMDKHRALERISREIEDKKLAYAAVEDLIKKTNNLMDRILQNPDLVEDPNITRESYAIRNAFVSNRLGEKVEGHNMQDKLAYISATANDILENWGIDLKNAPAKHAELTSVYNDAKNKVAMIPATLETLNINHAAYMDNLSMMDRGTKYDGPSLERMAEEF